MLVQNYVSEGKKEEAKNNDKKFKTKKIKAEANNNKSNDKGTPHLKVSDKLTKNKYK